MPSINIMQGDLVLNFDGQDRFSYLQSLFEYCSMPLSYQAIGSLPIVFDDEQYADLIELNDIIILDSQHWYYDDDVFEKYINKLAEAKFFAVRIADSMWNMEFPVSYRPDSFLKTAIDRTKKLYNVFQKKSPGTCIVSPTIEEVREEDRSLVIDYFRACSKCFAVYGFACDFNPLQESIVAKHTALLNSVLTCGNLPIWVVRWCMASHQTAVMSHKIGGEQLEIPTYIGAARRFRQIYDLVNSLGSVYEWFFTGAGQDSFSISKKPSETCYWRRGHVEMDDWDHRHFGGLYNYEGQLKKPVIQAFVNLAPTNYKGEPNELRNEKV